MLRFVVVALLFLALTNATLTPSSDAEHEREVQTLSSDKPSCKERFGDSYTVKVESDDDEAYPHIDEATNELVLTVQYGGGCKNHKFSAALHPTESGAELLYVHHHADNDLCKKLVREQVRIPLHHLDGRVKSGTFVILPEGSDYESIRL